MVTDLRNVAFGAVKDHTDFVATLGAKHCVDFFASRFGHVQAASLEHNALVTVIVDRDFGVGRVTCIDIVVIFLFGLIPKPTAVAENRIGVSVQT